MRVGEARVKTSKDVRMSILLDPKFFNYLIMALYVLNSARWLMHGNYADVAYWLSAFAITATVTFGYDH